MRVHLALGALVSCWEGGAGEEEDLPAPVRNVFRGIRHSQPAWQAAYTAFLLHRLFEWRKGFLTTCKQT
jgi:hypothetical protein